MANHPEIEANTYEARGAELERDLRAAMIRLEIELLMMSIRAPALRPVLAPFVRAIQGNAPATRLGRFIERVLLEYRMLRLERDYPKARTVSR